MPNRISLELEPSVAKAVPNKGGRPRKEIASTPSKVSARSGVVSGRLDRQAAT